MPVIVEVAEFDDIVDLPITEDVEIRDEAIVWILMLGSMAASPDTWGSADYLNMHWPNLFAALGKLDGGADIAQQFRDSIESQSITDLRLFPRLHVVFHRAADDIVITEMDDERFVGSVVRRMDAIYNLVDMPFTFSEVHSASWGSQRNFHMRKCLH